MVSTSLFLHNSLLKPSRREDVHARTKNITSERPEFRMFETLQLARSFYWAKYSLGALKAIPIVGSPFYPVDSPSPPSSPSSVGSDILWDQLSWKMERTSLG